MPNTQAIAISLMLFALPTVSSAQDFSGAIVNGLAKQGVDSAKDLAQSAPGQMSGFLSGEPRKFDSEEACLSELQLAVNAGVALGNSMPFSNVWIFETGDGPTARFRLLVNGAKIHAEVHCKNDELIATKLPWEADLPEAEPYNNGLISAGLGAWFINNARSSDVDTAEEQQSSQLPEIEETSPPTAPSGAEGKALVDAALADIFEKNATPELTAGEKIELSKKVEQCWNVGSLSSEALRTTVVLEFELERDGTVAGEIDLVSSTGDAAATSQAFEAARRAITRCGARGFNLPTEKYDRWKEVSLTFDPEAMKVSY